MKKSNFTGFIVVLTLILSIIGGIIYLSYAEYSERAEINKVAFRECVDSSDKSVNSYYGCKYSNPF